LNCYQQQNDKKNCRKLNKVRLYSVYDNFVAILL